MKKTHFLTSFSHVLLDMWHDISLTNIKLILLLTLFNNSVSLTTYQSKLMGHPFQSIRVWGGHRCHIPWLHHHCLSWQTKFPVHHSHHRCSLALSPQVQSPVHPPYLCAARGCQSLKILILGGHKMERNINQNKLIAHNIQGAATVSVECLSLFFRYTLTEKDS